MSDCPKEVFSLLISCFEKSERQNKRPRHDSHSLDWAVSSTLSPNHFAHHLSAGGLQWSHAAPGQEPHAFVFVAAVHNVDAIAHDRVIKSGAGILCDEAEELRPPWIIGVTKDLVSERLEFFDAHY